MGPRQPLSGSSSAPTAPKRRRPSPQPTFPEQSGPSQSPASPNPIPAKNITNPRKPSRSSSRSGPPPPPPCRWLRRAPPVPAEVRVSINVIPASGQNDVGSGRAVMRLSITVHREWDTNNPRASVVSPTLRLFSRGRPSDPRNGGILRSARSLSRDGRVHRSTG